MPCGRSMANASARNSGPTPTSSAFLTRSSSRRATAGTTWGLSRHGTRRWCVPLPRPKINIDPPATRSPRAFTFSLENAVCKDSYRRTWQQHRQSCENPYRQQLSKVKLNARGLGVPAWAGFVRERHVDLESRVTQGELAAAGLNQVTVAKYANGDRCYGGATRSTVVRCGCIDALHRLSPWYCAVAAPSFTAFHRGTALLRHRLSPPFTADDASMQRASCHRPLGSAFLSLLPKRLARRRRVDI